MIVTFKCDKMLLKVHETFQISIGINILKLHQ